MRAANAFSVMQVTLAIDMLVCMVMPMIVMVMAVMIGMIVVMVMIVGVFLPLDFHIVFAASTNRTHGFSPWNRGPYYAPYCAPFGSIHATANTPYFKKEAPKSADYLVSPHTHKKSNLPV